MRDKRTSQLRRGLAVLAVLALGLAAFAPAFGAAPVKKQIKKGATKVLKQKIDDFGNPIFVEEDEFDRVTGVRLNNGGSATLYSKGPFTVKALCNLDGANIRGQIAFTTSEAGSYLYGYDYGEEQPFDPADGEIIQYELTGDLPGVTPEAYEAEHDSPTSVYAPSGTTFSSVWRIMLNFDGSHCIFDGWAIDLTP